MDSLWQSMIDATISVINYLTDLPLESVAAIECDEDKIFVTNALLKRKNKKRNFML